jgi:DNA polymerase IV
MTERTIMHVDMNAFFASVEQQANPELRGRAIAVTGGGHRTVITTSSYEARARGVKTGMAVWEAKRLCPELIIVIGDNRKYTYTSKKIMQMMFDYTPLVEVFSVDEAFMDVTHSLKHLYGTPERIARLLKEQIRETFGLTCSIGIAPNKLLAKLASDMQKPDGLTVIQPEDVSRIMETLPVKELCGIGKSTERKLALMSIYTCGELGRCDEDRLTSKFGIVGRALKRMGQGLDDSPVVPHHEDEQVKSVGHSMTLSHDISRREDILRNLLQLSEMVGRRARRYGVKGRTISLYIRYADFFTNVGKQDTLSGAINLSQDIYDAAVKILDSIELQQPIRLLGVSLSKLEYQVEQLSLFSDEQRRSDLARAMDSVNDRFGTAVVTFGSLLKDGDRGNHVISPAWRPSGIRSVDIK